MKKNILLYALFSCLVLAFTACSDDYEDATKKHIYSSNEDEPVKNKPKATVAASYDMFAGDTDPTIFSLVPYADMIQEQMGVTIDELIDGIGKGTIRVCPINANRNLWSKSAPANAGGDYAWHLNNSGNVTDANSEYLYATMEFDPAIKGFKITLDEKAGGTVQLVMGFAMAGDFDTHVRFVFTITAFDMSFVVQDIEIPAGDYNAYQLKFADIAENIQYAFGMTPEEFDTAIDPEAGGTLTLYMIDHSTKLFMWDGVSTANNGGYWVNSSNEICKWGEEGFAYFLEPWTGEDMSLAIGRAPGWDAGTVFDVKFGVSNADKTKSMTFYLTVTLQ